jgi:hypothetical protein
MKKTVIKSKNTPKSRSTRQKKVLKMPTERLTLAQIQARYWNKWVAMADVVYEPKQPFVIKDAIVFCASKNMGLAYKKQGAYEEGPYKIFAVKWIGDSLKKENTFIIV